VIPFIHIISFTNKPTNSDQQGWAATCSPNINSIVHGRTRQSQLAARSLKQRHESSGGLISHATCGIGIQKHQYLGLDMLLHQKRSHLLPSSRQCLGNVDILSSSPHCNIQVSKWQASLHTTTLNLLILHVLFSVISFCPNQV
jgi:hypothetical protein